MAVAEAGNLVRGTTEANRDLATSPGAFLPGDILPFVGDVAPEGWRLCEEGATVPRNSPLGLRLAGRYGAGDGSSTYNLPGLTGRMPLGKRLGVDVGEKGGALLHSHQAGGLTLPSHAHSGAGTYLPAHGHGHNLSIPSHRHGVHIMGAELLGSGDGMGELLLTQATGYAAAGIGGGVAASGNWGLAGSTGGMVPTVSGRTTDAEPAWATVNWIIKT